MNKIGDNNPPLTPFDVASAALADLKIEASNYLDGQAIVTQAEADAVGRLLNMGRLTEKLIDQKRVEEKKPHDELANSVQAKYKPLMTDVERIVSVVKQSLADFMKAEEAKREARAKEAMDYAQRQLEKVHAMKEAPRTGTRSLNEKALLDEAAHDASEALKAVYDIEREKIQVRTGGRSATLKTQNAAEITDYTAFARWVWKSEYKNELFEFLNGLADRMARRNREAPGMVINQTKVAS